MDVQISDAAARSLVVDKLGAAQGVLLEEQRRLKPREVPGELQCRQEEGKQCKATERKNRLFAEEREWEQQHAV